MQTEMLIYPILTHQNIIPGTERKKYFTTSTRHLQFSNRARNQASSERDYVFIFWKNPESYKFLTKAKQLQSSIYQNADLWVLSYLPI